MDAGDVTGEIRYLLTDRALMLIVSEELSRASRLAEELSDLATPETEERTQSAYWGMVIHTRNICGLLTIWANILRTWQRTSGLTVNQQRNGNPPDGAA